MKTNKIFFILGMALLLATSGGLIGCSGEATADDDSSTQQATPAKNETSEDEGKAKGNESLYRTLRQRRR